ncbi:SDR family oxidoreductase [Arthrobacter tecti]
MKVVIAGAHGKIARQLTRLLNDGGHQVTGLIRSEQQIQDINDDGGTPVVLDLESGTVQEVQQHLQDADAVVFAAGAGSGSGIERKDTVDRAASVKLADAAEAAGVGRFIQVSAMGTDAVRDGQRPDGLDDVFYAYLQAKLAAEEDLKVRRTLSWTILRPGQLTDDPGTGRVKLSSHAGRGPVPRQDVAAVLSALLESRLGDRRVLELVAGPESIADAIAAIPR